MAIRINLKGGSDFSNESPTYQDINDSLASLYRKVYADNTGGSIASSTTETDLATITITQDDLGSSFNALISSGIQCNGATGGTNHVFRLYVNGSAVKTITLQTNSSGVREDNGTSINYLATGLDSTAGNIIIKVTGQNSANSSAEVSEVLGLTVDAIEDNS